MARHFVALFAASLLLFSTGCASYASRVREPRAAFEAGNYDSAAEMLQKLAEKGDTDELLYWMDLGVVHHVQARYEDALKAFKKAETLSEIHDYTSLSEESGAILLSDEVVKYKGEDFEKILVNVYMAIDYAMLGKFEDALVEARRVNHKLDLMISKGGLPYEQNAFAKYLAAALFEAQGELNDAFVDYRQLLKWKKGEPTPYLGVPLLRIADRLKATQEYEEYRKKFPAVSNYKLSKKEGEIVVIFEQGRVPIKVPSPNFRLVPTFQKRYYRSDYAYLNARLAKKRVRSHPLFDIEATAIKELDHRIAGIVAKKIAGVAVKEAAAYGVQKATDSKLAGALTSIFLHVQDQADLRSWTTLPARLHIARLTLPAGRHDIELDMVDSSGTEVKSKSWSNVEVKGGQVVFLSHRVSE